jgi:excisionase family DNA binding protein
MDFFTTKHAAKILGVNDSRVRQFILAGRLPAQKVGRDWLILESDLEKVKDRKPGRPPLKNKGE